VPQLAHCAEWWPFGAAWAASGAAPAAAKAATKARREAMVEMFFMMVPLGVIVMICWEQRNGGGLFRKEQNRIKCKRL
jgi:hypothetical protein